MTVTRSNIHSAEVRIGTRGVIPELFTFVNDWEDAIAFEAGEGDRDTALDADAQLAALSDALKDAADAIRGGCADSLRQELLGIAARAIVFAGVAAMSARTPEDG